ncbi:MAG: hypothetical protein GYB67_03870 [Chloroflexi bacterium]|nr:hypothetical protein [Chloroflexota bacterium]
MTDEPTNDAFLAFVQAHERSWGLETYPGRPDLAKILSAPVVVFWSEEQPAKTSKTARAERFTISLHDDLKAVEQYVSSLILRLRVEMPKRRLARIFVNQREVRVRGVQVLFEPVKPDQS